MKRVDDRRGAEVDTHHWLVIGTDSFLSGWGQAEGGNSYAAWACRPADRHKVLQWVSSRSDMKRVRESVDLPGSKYRPGPHCAHLHIYVVNEGHPALGGAQ